MSNKYLYLEVQKLGIQAYLGLINTQKNQLVKKLERKSTIRIEFDTYNSYWSSYTTLNGPLRRKYLPLL